MQLSAIGCADKTFSRASGTPGISRPLTASLRPSCRLRVTFAVAASVYLGGPQAFGSQASVMDFALLVVVAWLPIVVLAGLRTFAARPPAASSKFD